MARRNDKNNLVTLFAIFSPAWGVILFSVRVCKTDMMSSLQILPSPFTSAHNTAVHMGTHEGAKTTVHGGGPQRCSLQLTKYLKCPVDLYGCFAL